MEGERDQSLFSFVLWAMRGPEKREMGPAHPPQHMFTHMASYPSLRLTGDNDAGRHPQQLAAVREPLRDIGQDEVNRGRDRNGRLDVSFCGQSI